MQPRHDGAGGLDPSRRAWVPKVHVRGPRRNGVSRITCGRHAPQSPRSRRPTSRSSICRAGPMQATARATTTPSPTPTRLHSPSRTSIAAQIEGHRPRTFPVKPVFRGCPGDRTCGQTAWDSDGIEGGHRPAVRLPADGLEYACGDFSENDGIHPGPGVREKVVDMLTVFFTTDPTTAPWFVAP